MPGFRRGEVERVVWRLPFGPGQEQVNLFFVEGRRLVRIGLGRGRVLRRIAADAPPLSRPGQGRAEHTVMAADARPGPAFPPLRRVVRVALVGVAWGAGMRLCIDLGEDGFAIFKLSNIIGV